MSPPEEPKADRTTSVVVGVLVGVVVIAGLCGGGALLLLDRAPDLTVGVAETDSAEPYGAEMELVETPVLRLREEWTPYTPVTIDEVLRANRARDTEAVDRAVAAHEPLSGTLGSVHTIADAALARLAEIEPAWASVVGDHVHVRAPAAPGVELSTRLALLADATRRSLDALETEELSAHDRADLTAFRRQMEATVGTHWHEAVLRWLLQAPVALVSLTHFKCCGRAERARDAALFLERLAAEIDALPDRDLSGRSSLVDIVRKRVQQHATYVEGVPSAFLGLDAPDGRRLHEAAEKAADAFRAVEGRLVANANASRERVGVGRPAYAALLHTWSVETSPAEIMDAAVREIGASVAKLREIESEGEFETDLLPNLLATRAEAHLFVLQQATKNAVAVLPEDPGVRVSRVPTGWPEAFAFLYAPPRGVDAPSIVFADNLDGAPDSDPFARAFDGRALRHVLAHEAYPGHHVHHLYSRDVCAIRRVFTNPVCQEGWAVHAVSVARLSGGTPDDRIDRWLEVQDRVERAWWALVDIAVNCLGATAAEIQTWDLPHDELSDPNWLAEAAEESPGQLLTYFVGEPEVLRLELRARDEGLALPEFRANFMRAGPLHPKLLEPELFR